MPFTLFSTVGFFWKLLVLYPILLCSILFIFSSHCHFAFHFFLSVLSILHAYFVHIPHSPEVLFEVLVYLLSSCLRGQYKVFLLQLEGSASDSQEAGALAK